MEQKKLDIPITSNGLTTSAYLRAAEEYNFRLRKLVYKHSVYHQNRLAKSVVKKSKSKEKLDYLKLKEVAQTLRMMDEI